MSQPRDPIEERDILKILDALEDKRVIEKIAVLLIHRIRTRAFMDTKTNSMIINFEKEKTDANQTT